MIKVTNLTKQFGTHKAVNDVSFELKQGEIFGFLGPKGTYINRQLPKVLVLQHDKRMKEKFDKKLAIICLYLEKCNTFC